MCIFAAHFSVFRNFPPSPFTTSLPTPPPSFRRPKCSYVVLQNIRTSLRARLAADKRALAEAAAPPPDPAPKRPRPQRVLASLEISPAAVGWAAKPGTEHAHVERSMLDPSDRAPWPAQQRALIKRQKPSQATSYVCSNACKCGIWDLSDGGLYRSSPLPALATALAAAKMELRPDAFGGRVLVASASFAKNELLCLFDGLTRIMVPGAQLVHPYELQLDGLGVIPFP